MPYLIYFLIALAASFVFTPLVMRAAFKLKIIDVPGTHPKKIHEQPTALLGGVAVFLSFLSALLLYLYFGKPDLNVVPMKFFLGIIFGGLILVLGGAIDDKYNLPPKVLWLFPALASLVVIWSGIGVGIKFISNPFGTAISLDYIFLGLPLSAIFVWVWMMGMIFTTKLLDGLDGLCAGIALIGGLTMFALSLGEKINQPITASISIIFAGALLGYLFFAFNPASIFLGESGSTFLGFILGVLAIISGAKIATALLVMGIPILDVAWVIVKRLWYHRSPFSGDRQHLHFKLLDIGLTQRQAVLVLYAISAVFGGVAVFLQSMGKLVALVILTCLMVGLALTTVVLYKRQHPHIPDLFDKAK
ncbi:MAG: undecaprenyl/decaprenyl-phosphate alpha-N-acetylglucosaminyl 1-phosphate transferase [Candidatus Doudnabacteria bacterium]|nr:undecaprenyl/decaprenyl-phosphate alpha-N-acetylglucosaminyl 1-phosphate transferase [Candidatus Doudnabacteria bacterium]